MKLRTTYLGGIGAALAIVCLTSPAAPAAKAVKSVKASAVAPVLLEAWPGQRVLLLLPLQLGEDWNANADFGRAILPAAEQNLQNALQATGKFSVIQPYRFNPILQRALQEGRITRDQMTALTKTPTLANARIVMDKLDASFDQVPFIGQFSLEELTLSGDSKQTRAQIKVTGRLYEVGSDEATSVTSVTSDTVGSTRTTASVLGAASDAFARLAAEFTKPIAEPVLDASGGPTRTTPTTPVTPTTRDTTRDTTSEPHPDVTPRATGVPPVIPPAGTTTGTTPGTGMKDDVVPQLPAAKPPLDINVPADR